MKQIICLLVVLVNLSALAQKSPVTWTDSYKIQRRENVIRMLGAHGDDFFVYKGITGKEPEHRIEVLDKASMKLKSSASLTLPTIDGEETRFYQLMMVDGRLLLITSFIEKRSDIRSLYGTWMNKEGQALDLPVLLSQITLNRRNENQTFGIQLSEDSSMVFIYNESTLDRRSNERFSFKVVDLDLETVWKKELELPYRSELLEINQYLLDSKGQLHMMSGIASDKRNNTQNERRLSEKRYIVISFDPVANKVKELEVDLGDKWVTATTFAIDDQGDLAIGGFYSNDRYFSIAGSFFFRVSAETKKVISSGLEPFETSFLKKFMSDRRADRGDELNDFYFDHMVRRPDGGATLVAEQYYIVSRYRSDITTGRQEIINYYHYNDIILVDVAADGKVNWTNRIAKEQISSNDKGPYSSYALTADQDSIYILFNDDPANEEYLKQNPENSPKTLNSLKSSVVTKIAVGLDGTMTRETMFKSKKEETVLKPKVHISPESGELFIYARFRKQYRFGRLEF
ncbi:MAG: hypothetical protein MK081_00375 [Flavobacteriales bacterium]|nr:hypothetical protein [Flavobacteriales bacterium]